MIRIRPRQTVALNASFMLAMLVAAAGPARAFDSYPSGLLVSSPHDQITRAAAQAAGFMNAAVIRNLQYAVRMPDRTESQWSPAATNWFRYVTNANYNQSHHCDRNPPATSAASFLSTAAYIRSQNTAAIADAKNGNQAAVITDIGRGLHALQDCEAHSNYIDLTPADQMQFRAALWDTKGTVEPPAALRLTGYQPGAANPERPPNDPYPHADFAKDNPRKNAAARIGYHRAYAAAVARSTYFLNLVLSALTPAQQTAVQTTSVSNSTADALYTSNTTQTCPPTGCTISGGGTTVQFLPGTFPTATNVSVLGVPSSFYSSPDQTQAVDGNWTVFWVEIRPEDSTFTPPALVTMTFSPSDVAMLDTSKLKVYEPDPNAGAWVPVPGATVDPTTDTATFAIGAGGTYAIGGPMANGNGQDFANCAVTGDASASPAIPFNTPQTGAFSFNSLSLDCVGGDASDTGEADTFTLDGSGSTGTYTNNLCGTGTADGTATIKVTSGSANTVAELNGGTVSYHIDLNAGTGVLTVTGLTFPAGSDNFDWGATGTGLIEITPDQLSNPLSNFCANSVAVKGSIEIASLDNGAN
jgi:hypothetical protein